VTNRKLRVLHVGKYYPPHRGGMETHLQTLCSELKQQIDVRVIVASGSSEGASGMDEGVWVERLPTIMTVASTPVCLTMPARIRAADADLVHIHHPNPMASLAFLLSGFKGPMVTTWHSDVVRQRVLNSLYAPIEKKFLNRSSTIIATSPNYLDGSKTLRGFRNNCAVVPFGIPLEPLQRHDEAAIRDIRQRFGERIALSVGRLVYYKGLPGLIRAIKDVDATLLIVGDGPLRTSLEQLSRDLGLAERVRFLGQVDDLVPYLQACDVFVLPSNARSEAFGIVQLEAMGCGKPVINTQLESGVPYVSLDRVTGITVSPDDSAALSAALNELFNNEELRRQYGEAAYQRVSTEFTLRLMVDRTIEVYNRAMNVSNGAPYQHRNLNEPSDIPAA
jgi:glycosyltransferase involved in cell wall biosynthesis